MAVRSSASTWLRAIDYVATPLAPEHVLASAAIPGAFPAVEVRRPREAKGWYGDGGVRLNAPLKPALELGADRVIVIGLNSSVTAGERPARPDAIDGAAQLLQVVLGDQIADDVATLATVNETLVPSGSSAGSARARHGGRRTIPYIFIAPAIASRSGAWPATSTSATTPASAASLRNTDLALLGRVVSAERSAVHGELLSYLFLAREFIEELIDARPARRRALGRRSPRRRPVAGRAAARGENGLGARRPRAAKPRGKPAQPGPGRAQPPAEIARVGGGRPAHAATRPARRRAARTAAVSVSMS